MTRIGERGDRRTEEDESSGGARGSSFDAPPEGGDEPGLRSPTLLEDVRAVARALQGGVFATVVMTTFRLPLLRSLPPTANFWAKYVGDGEPEEYRGIGLLLHLLYGAAGGAAFGLAYDRLRLFPGATTEARGVVWGGLYGLALSVFGDRVILRRVLGMPVQPDTETVFHTSHLIYGLALGGWVGSRLDQPVEYEEYEKTQ